KDLKACTAARACRETSVRLKASTGPPNPPRSETPRRDRGAPRILCGEGASTGTKPLVEGGSGTRPHVRLDSGGMRLIGLVVALSLTLAPLFAGAQQADKVPRIGFLAAPSRADRTPPRDAFVQGLRDLGWVEGKDVVIEQRFADGRVDRLSELAA